MSRGMGQWAEDVAAKYLANKGFEIHATNWKNRWCEIDIVMQKATRVHFVEVKFRKNTLHGSGLDYITSRKAKQMEFAALIWIGEHGWNGDYQLDVVAVTGEDNPKITYLPNAIGF